MAGLLRQSDPALAIFEPGNAWGMPYAPLALPALVLQLLSFDHRESRQLNWPDQPRAASIERAIDRGSPDVVPELLERLLEPVPRLVEDVVVAFLVGAATGVRLKARLAAVGVETFGERTADGIGFGFAGTGFRAGFGAAGGSALVAGTGADAATTSVSAAAGSASLPPPATTTMAIPSAT